MFNAIDVDDDVVVVVLIYSIILCVCKYVVYGFKTIEFSENTKFDIDISPFSSGTNTISVKIGDSKGNPINEVWTLR